MLSSSDLKEKQFVKINFNYISTGVPERKDRNSYRPKFFITIKTAQ